MPETGSGWNYPGNREILAMRPPRNHLDPDIPWHFLHEQEPGPDGLERVNTIFLTGRECVFKCLMCDLWKNTLPGPGPTAPGAILRQLDYALERLPPATTIKLYNSSNFFDPGAVPPEDYPGLFKRLQSYGRIIVENHPRLTGEACLRFRDGLRGSLEIAMGLETIHPKVLPALNKQLSPEDFRKATSFLTENGIRVRAFILLNPPYLTDAEESIRWAEKTVRFAFDCGAHCCSVIATRPGNGIMESLQASGDYHPPSLEALEELFERSLKLAREFSSQNHAPGKPPAPSAANQKFVFADTWDLGFLSSCPHCFSARIARLEKMNKDQIIHQPIACSCHSAHV